METIYGETQTRCGRSVVHHWDVSVQHNYHCAGLSWCPVCLWLDEMVIDLDQDDSSGQLISLRQDHTLSLCLRHAQNGLTSL